MTDAPATAALPPAAPESLDSVILHVLMETIPDRIYFKDLQSRFVRNNAAHARSLGAASPEDVVGKTDADFFSREHAEHAYADEQEIIRSGRPIIGKIERLTMRDGTLSWASSTKMPWRDPSGRIIGTFGLSRDVTATKRAEEKLTEERNLLRTIIDHLPSRIYVKDTTSHYLLNNKSHLEMLGAKTQENATGRTTVDFFPGERGRQALVDDQQVLNAGVPILNQEKSDFGNEGHVRWSLTTKVPLHDIRGQLIGLVGISHDITRRKLAEEQLHLRTEEMETDVRMARQVQEAFLTRAYPVFPRGVPVEASALHFSHQYIAATTLGGDFFDLVQHSDTKCGFLVCDVMGHGVRAGLLTALIRGVVEEMGERAENPAHVLSEINRSLIPIVQQTGQPVFATAFFAVIDTSASTLSFANAGHPPVLILRAGSRSVTRLVLEDPEPATGLIDGFAYSRHENDLLPGDVLLGYTDGVIEAGNNAGDIFGEERLSQLLSQCGGRTSVEVTERVVSELRTFSGRTIFEDDVCVVAIEPTGKTCTVLPLSYEI
jgi:sigma-B regulation protein RsbU (phosphoserine phosphatase)